MCLSKTYLCKKKNRKGTEYIIFIHFRAVSQLLSLTVSWISLVSLCLPWIWFPPLTIRIHTYHWLTSWHLIMSRSPHCSNQSEQKVWNQTKYIVFSEYFRFPECAVIARFHPWQCVRPLELLGFWEIWTETGIQLSHYLNTGDPDHRILLQF